jgi:AbrB family looped-hinge helix DNA binding protein
MITAKVSEKYRVTIPPLARKKLHINAGDIVKVRIRDAAHAICAGNVTYPEITRRRTQLLWHCAS